MKELIGRKENSETLRSLLYSNKSEFVAVYGRRRVGKTFLIRSAFNQQFCFEVSGLAHASLKQQLTNFNMALQRAASSIQTEPAKDWLTAFQQLIAYLEKSRRKKKIVFIDELPWFDTSKSGFMQALEHFWNSWASARNDIILIGCGSATSWIINKLINNKGGLHNRLTKRLKVVPFTLAECEAFMQSKNIMLDRYQIIQLYMVMGGIPFYWEEVQKGKSAMQNIVQICFTENGLLRTEFGNLYASLFSNHERHLSIVNVLSQKSAGLSREEIIQISGLADAGSTTRLLTELEESGFIRKYLPFGKKQRMSLYQLVDFYTHFYLKFIKDAAVDENWLNYIDTPKYRAWSGYAFEQICLCHTPQIQAALGISGVQTSVSSWRSKSKQKGAQIDLVIDRRDQVINLCEMKFSIHPFTISKAYAEELRNKSGTFRTETKSRKALFLTMITTFGVEENTYSGIVQNYIQMDEIFSF